jgi:alpha-beta hydrolase superfamily lysophospholipase
LNSKEDEEMKTMNKRTLTRLALILVVALLTGCILTIEEGTGDIVQEGANTMTELTPVTGNYADVNGISLYYEIHGTGAPLVLLHGGVGAIEMFSEVLPMLAQGHQVIAVDLQAHGRTADIDRPMTFEAMADDIAALITHLGLERADVMGYSLGGVALQTAIRHPEVVRKLVLVSTPFSRMSFIAR